MHDPLRLAIAAVLMGLGVAMAVYAGYLQYAALPEEHTFAAGGKRLALAVVGIAMIVGGTQLLPT